VPVRMNPALSTICEEAVPTGTSRSMTVVVINPR
jgi:hypothetical protein